MPNHHFIITKFRLGILSGMAALCRTFIAIQLNLCAGLSRLNPAGFYRKSAGGLQAQCKAPAIK